MMMMSIKMVMMVLMIIKMTKMMLASTLLPKQCLVSIHRFIIDLILRTPGLLIPLLVKVVPEIWLDCELVVGSHLP